MAERWLRTRDARIQAAMVKLSADPDWEVREQLAASLGEMPQAAKVPTIVGVLEQNATDPVVMDAALSGLAGDEARVPRTIAGRGCVRKPYIRREWDQRGSAVDRPRSRARARPRQDATKPWTNDELAKLGGG